MLILKITIIAASVIIGLYLLDRLCLWAEAKGWVFYRKKKPSGNALGASALELQGIFESGKTIHVIEAKTSKQGKNNNAGPDNP